MSTHGSVSDARRKRLEGIRQREAARARMSRMEVMLTQSMVRKWGTPGVKHLKAAIEARVKDFLSSRSPSARAPGGEELARLEESLERLKAEFSSAPPPRSSSRGYQSPHQPSDIQAPAALSDIEALENQSGSKGKGNSAASPVLSQVTHDWRAFAVLDQIQDEETAKEASASRKLKQAHLRVEYQRTSEQQQRAKAEKERMKALDREKQEEELRAWKAEEERARQKIMSKHIEEAEVRAKQVEEVNKRREAEREALHKAEMADLECARKEMEAEAAKAEAKKLRERARMAAILQENIRNQKLRQEQALEAAEAEKRLMREYAERQEREEARRAAALAARMKKYEDIGTFWLEQGAGKKEMEERRKVELSILKEAQKREEEIQKKEAADAEKKRLRELRSAHENARVMEEVRQTRAREQEVERQYANQLLQESQAHQRAEREAQQKKRAAMLQYRAQLESQVQETERRNKELGMTDIEYKLNCDRIKKLEADAHLQELVGKKLGIVG